ncbi:MAG: DEAD/DEAH box helicase, partial [Alphaproteobacteria bacterium]|nr:DEAD/DEAH box helicase [Alphaproteobacteria bacterium]
FALPILQAIQATKQTDKSKTIKALILAPTRELAIQIGENIADYSKHLSVKHAVIFGGVSQHPQTDALRRGLDILVATPGRLLDLMQQGLISLNSIEYFVLDEADRMLDMGFINDIKKVIAKLPAKRQSLFFSATISPEINKLAQTLLKDPAFVKVTPISSTAELVAQSVYYVNKEDKRALLRHILKNPEVEHALVFTRTKHGA